MTLDATLAIKGIDIQVIFDVGPDGVATGAVSTKPGWTASDQADQLTGTRTPANVDLNRRSTLAAWPRVSRTRRSLTADVSVCSGVCSRGVQWTNLSVHRPCRHVPKSMVVRLSRTPATK